MKKFISVFVSICACAFFLGSGSVLVYANDNNNGEQDEIEKKVHEIIMDIGNNDESEYRSIYEYRDIHVMPHTIVEDETRAYYEEIIRDARNNDSNKFLVKSEYLDDSILMYGYVVCPRCSANIIRTFYQDDKITGEVECHIGATDIYTGEILHDEIITYYNVTKYSCPNVSCGFSSEDKQPYKTGWICMHTTG